MPSPTSCGFRRSLFATYARIYAAVNIGSPAMPSRRKSVHSVAPIGPAMQHEIGATEIAERVQRIVEVIEMIEGEQRNVEPPARAVQSGEFAELTQENDLRPEPSKLSVCGGPARHDGTLDVADVTAQSRLLDRGFEARDRGSVLRAVGCGSARSRCSAHEKEGEKPRQGQGIHGSEVRSPPSGVDSSDGALRCPPFIRRGTLTRSAVTFVRRLKLGIVWAVVRKLFDGRPFAAAVRTHERSDSCTSWRTLSWCRASPTPYYAVTPTGEPLFSDSENGTT